MSDTNYHVLILGASYGSLLATKLALAGHSSCLVCLPESAALINAEGTVVRLPLRHSAEVVEIRSVELSGKITATSPPVELPGDYDLVVLAMQEPQYSDPSVKQLISHIAQLRMPCMSIMNMPPLPFLARLALDVNALRECYTDASVWDGFAPELMTLASPDPQAFRPPARAQNVLEVGLPTNFKVARFDADQHNAMLRRMQSDIENIRYPHGTAAHELPVKLKLHDSVFVPLAKWPMLITGNYRCVQAEAVRSIRQTVHIELRESRQIYDWVGKVCQALGAQPSDLVPFDKYADAASDLVRPASAARALAAGVKNIERVDKLVQCIAAAKGLQHDELDAVVGRVDRWLTRNRAA